MKSINVYKLYKCLIIGKNAVSYVNLGNFTLTMF